MLTRHFLWCIHCCRAPPVPSIWMVASSLCWVYRRLPACASSVQNQKFSPFYHLQEVYSGPLNPDEQIHYLTRNSAIAIKESVKKPAQCFFMPLKFKNNKVACIREKEEIERPWQIVFSTVEGVKSPTPSLYHVLINLDLGYKGDRLPRLRNISGSSQLPWYARILGTRLMQPETGLPNLNLH